MNGSFLLVRVAEKKRPKNQPEVKYGRAMEFLTEIKSSFKISVRQEEKPGSHLMGQRLIPVVNLPYPLFDFRKI